MKEIKRMDAIQRLTDRMVGGLVEDYNDGGNSLWGMVRNGMKGYADLTTPELNERYRQVFGDFDEDAEGQPEVMVVD